MIKEIRGDGEEDGIDVIDVIGQEDPSKINIENKTKNQEVISKII